MADGWSDSEHVALVADAGCSHPALYYDDLNNRTLKGWCWRCRYEMYERSPAGGKATDHPPVGPGERILDAGEFFEMADDLIGDFIEDGPDPEREKLIASMRALDCLTRRGVTGTRRDAHGQIVYVITTESGRA